MEEYIWQVATSALVTFEIYNSPLDHKLFSLYVFHFFSNLNNFIYLSIFYWLCYYSSPIVSPLHWPPPGTPIGSSIPPPLFMSRGHTYKSLASPFPILHLIPPCLFLPINYAPYSLYLFCHSPPSSVLKTKQTTQKESLSNFHP